VVEEKAEWSDTEHLRSEAGAFDFSKISELKALTAKDPSRFDKLISLFLSGMADHLSLMRKACDESDVATFRECAHGLKGTSANMGARRLSSLCAALEKISESHQLHLTGPKLDTLEVEASRVLAVLDAERKRLSGAGQ
jgi:two-component system, sensor histidine kinase and response regulator